MNEVRTSPEPWARKRKEAVDSAGREAKDGIQSMQQKASETLDKAGAKVDAENTVAPTVDEVRGQSQKRLQQGREMYEDVSQRVREAASQASDAAVAYTRDEPLKAMLMSAAAGALAMGLLAVMWRSDAGSGPAA